MLYVAVDVGCIECGEPSGVIGVFTTRDAAQAACDSWFSYDSGWRGGQHHYEVHEVAAVDVAVDPIDES